MLATYRWFFRVLAIVCILFSLFTIFLLPSTPLPSKNEVVSSRWKRMDPVGVIIMGGSLICFTFALSQGPISGWGSPSFIAPIVIGSALAPIFFLWESRIPAQYAVLPASIWGTRTIVIFSVVLLFPLSFHRTSQLQYATYYSDVLHWESIHIATAILPQGIIAVVTGGVIQAIHQIVTKPRTTIPIGTILIAGAEILQNYSGIGKGNNYWTRRLPGAGYILGSAGAISIYLASAINLVTICPPETSGVIAAWVQVVAQAGGSIALAIQAGLNGGDVVEWKTDAKGYWFLLGGVCAAQFVVFYKPPHVFK